MDPTLEKVRELGVPLGHKISDFLTKAHDRLFDETKTHIIADNAVLLAAMIGVSSVMVAIIADLHDQVGKKMEGSEIEKKWHAAQESITFYMNDFMAKHCDGIPNSFTLMVEPKKEEP